MPDCNLPEENTLVDKARRMISTYEDMAEMIRLGAYRKGSDEAVDTAVQFHPALDAFLAQDRNDRSDLATGYAELAQIYGERDE